MLLDGYWTIEHALHLKNSENEGKGSPKGKTRTMEEKESHKVLVYIEIRRQKQMVEPAGFEPATRRL